DKDISLGLVDGRNFWKNDFSSSLDVIDQVVKAVGEARVWIARSCSLLHVLCDLDLETNEDALPAEIKNCLDCATQKKVEVITLADLASGDPTESAQTALAANKKAIESKERSERVHNKAVKERVAALTEKDAQRKSVFSRRKKVQQEGLKLPVFPTTTIGSFPQTKEVRKTRFARKKNRISAEEYDSFIKKEIEESISW